MPNVWMWILGNLVALVAVILIVAMEKPTASLAPASTAPTNPLVGRWESAQQTRGGIGNWFDFGPDGAVTHRLGAMVNQTYRVEGNRLITTYVDPQGGKPEKDSGEIRFEGGVIVRKAPPAPSAPPEASLTPEEKQLRDRLSRDIRMTRVARGGPGDPPIVGTWSYPHYTGATAFEEYTADGRMFLRVPLQTKTGRYAIAGDTVTVAWKDGPSSAMRFRIEDAALILSEPGGRTLRYVRPGAVAVVPPPELPARLIAAPAPAPPSAAAVVVPPAEAKPVALDPPGAFLKADPAAYSGPCPVTIPFSGRISVARAGQPVSFRFLRSDGATAPIQRVVVDAAGSSDVQQTWTLGPQPGGSFSGWESILVLEPQRMESARADFRIRCR